MKNYLLLILAIVISISGKAQTHFTSAYTGGNADSYMNIYVYSAQVGGQDLQGGDEIGVFDGSICVGAAALSGVISPILSIQAAKSDAGVENGYTGGHNISIKMWDSSENIEYSATIQFTNPDGTGSVTAPTFSDGGSAFVRLIAQLALTINLTAENKVYDGTTTATVGYSVSGGTLSGDVSINVSNGAFSNKNAGTGKTVTASISASGDDASNYSFTFNESATANITKKNVTVSGTSVVTKVYDGTNTATLSGATLGGTISGDDVSLTNNGQGLFSQTSAGDNIPVTTAMSLTGSDASNYTLTQPTNVKGTVSKAGLTVTADNQTKIYGAVNPTLTVSYSGWITGENVSALTAEPTASATIDGTTDVGTYVDAITVSGGTATNYTFTYVAGDFTVTAKELTVSGATAESKTYDGATAASITGATLVGVVTGDDVSLDALTGSFAQADAGNGITVTAALTLTGTKKDNYTLTQPTGLTANISAASLTVTGAVAANKTYDGTTAATITGATLNGVLTGDDVSLDALTGSFAQADAGNGITVTAALTLAGTKKDNYTMTQPTGLSASITAKTIDVYAGTISRECNEYDPALTYTYSPDLISGDSFTGSLIREGGSSAGFYTILQGTLSLSGNYTLVFHSATFSIVDNPPFWETSSGNLNRTVEYNDADALAAAQALYPTAYDACDGAIGNINKTSGSFVAGNNCDVTGTYTNTWTATDGANQVSNVYTQTITVVDTQAPVFENIDAIRTTLDPGTCEKTITYPEIVVNDACLDSVKLVSGIGPNGSFPLGTTVEKWKATDKSGNVSTYSFEVIVKEVNIAPEIDQVSDLSVPKNTPQAVVDLTGIDATSICTPQEVISVQAEADNSELVSDIAVDYTSGSSTGKLTISLSSGKSGEANIRITVKDNGGTEDNGSDTYTSEFTLTVLSGNNAPEVTGSTYPQKAEPGSFFSYTIPDGLFTDPDEGGELSYSVSAKTGSLPEWLTFDSSSLTLSGTPTIEDMGNFFIIITATNSEGKTASTYLEIIVYQAADLSITGTLYEQNTPLDGGAYVALYKKLDTTPVTYEQVTYTTNSSEGKFGFYDLSQGNYIIEANIVNTEKYSNLLTTYYDQEDNWTNASVISLESSNRDVDMVMLEKPGLGTGAYKISGIVVKKEGNISQSGLIVKSVETNDEEGEPIAGITVLLKRNGEVVSSTFTDENGYYSFSNLPEGEYEVEVILPGYEQTEKVTVDRDESTSDEDSTNFTVWEDTNEITDIDDILTKASEITAFPNPTSGKFTVSASFSSTFGVRVYSVRGQLIMEKNDIKSQAILDLSGNIPGIYLVKIKTGNSELTKKLVLK